MERLREEKGKKTGKTGARLAVRFDDREHPAEQPALMEILWFPLRARRGALRDLEVRPARGAEWPMQWQGVS